MMRCFFISSLLAFALPVAAQQPNAITQPPTRISLSKPVSIPQSNTAFPALNSNIATTGLGFFCRQEIKMDKQTAVPLRFRLGSMQQTDWLESKPNAIKPQQ